MAALRFSSPDSAPLAEQSEAEWQKALDFCDRSMLTLALGLTCRDVVPEQFHSRIDRALRNNAQRWPRIKSVYREIADALDAAGVEFLVLKGFSNAPDYVSDPRHRYQSDLDLLCPPEQTKKAYEIAQQLGYEPIVEFDTHPINHFPALVRKTGWQWRGEYFDVEIPLALELHFQIWNQETERFGPQGLEELWSRRERRQLDDLSFPAFHPADAAANAALHMLRHLLRGGLRPSHVYELASMLHNSAANVEFWNTWLALHDASLRRLETISFLIAASWFDCRLPAVVLQEQEHLPSEVARWIELHALSPLASRFQPNKDELWLHWNLLSSTRDRAAVLRRRLLPVQLPGPIEAVYVRDEDRSWRVRWRYLVFAVSRIRRHARALPTTAFSAWRWFGGSIGLGREFWRFFFAGGLFEFGMFVFFMLYNLYLLRLGFDEHFIGLVSSAMTFGSIAGAILAAIAAQRFGLRRTLLVSFTLTALLAALRAYVTWSAPLIGLSFGAGLVSSAWAVAFAPAIASLTTEKNRARGFSFMTAAGISIGILGSQVAGRLPGWFLQLHLASSSVLAYRASLLLGCAMVLLAVLPFARVKIAITPQPVRKLYRPSPFVMRFLIAMVAWSLGTGAMNPFFNVFFARQHLPVQQIGLVFSCAQAAQVVAILLAPLAFRKFGLIRGIVGMRFATALALIALAASSGPVWPAVGYASYMMAQYSSEPGLFTFLMDGAAAGERNSASALNFLVTCAGQAIAAAITGTLLTRFGYPPVFVGAAVICVLAAQLFRVLLSTPKPGAPSLP